MAVDVRAPFERNERVCASCPNGEPATSVIDGVPQCNRCAGLRIMSDCPEVLGWLLAEKLRRG